MLQFQIEDLNMWCIWSHFSIFSVFIVIVLHMVKQHINYTFWREMVLFVIMLLCWLKAHDHSHFL